MKLFSILLIITLLSARIFAQHTTATYTNAAPPSLSYEAIIALPSPTKGSLVFDNTNNIPRVYNGSKWVPLLTTYELTTSAWKGGGTNGDEGKSIAVDANGNVYVTGHFRETATFGSTTLTAANNTPAANADIFIAKYNNSGTLLWAQKAGGFGEETAAGIATDANGNVYITGTFSGTASFGAASLVAGTNGSDTFIVKYNTNGTLQWARKCGGSSIDIALDPSGNIYVIGNLGIYGSYVFGSETLTGPKIYLVKYTNSGTFQWVKTEGGGWYDGGSGIATGSDGTVYITGNFRDQITIGTTTLTAGEVLAEGESPSSWQAGGFLAKYNSTGNLQWAKNTGTGGSRFAQDVTIDTNNNIYVTGYCSKTVLFGTTYLKSNGGMYIAKYKSTGDFVWVQNTLGPGGSQGARITTDATGNVYVTGIYNGPFVVFNATSKLTAAANAGQRLFVAKYSGDGLFQWARQTDANGEVHFSTEGIAVHANRTVYITGTFSISIYTSDATFDTISMQPYGSSDMFVMKIVD